MSAEGDSLFHPETGDYLGEVAFDEESGIGVLWDPSTGQVLRAMDADGAEYDPGEFQVVDPETGAPLYSPEAALHQRLDHVEELLQTPRPTYDATGPSAEQQQQQLADQVLADVADMEATQGRSFTRAETLAILQRATDAADRGQPISAWEAAQQAETFDKATFHDLDSHEGRTAFMAERWKDAERDQRGQQLDEPDPPQHEAYDVDDREDRVAWQVDKLEGRTDSSSLFSSAQLNEEAEMYGEGFEEE